MLASRGVGFIALNIQCENEEKWFRRWEEEKAEMQKAEAEAIAKMEALLQSQKAEADETKSTSEKSRPPTGSVKSGKSAKSTSSRQ
mmetsp:Transcript_109942/g.154174  ORF Transcript_109942/g.154174 Transcript_109942/m.154174 type:complete len:86 (-) Transcript_109942:97-354(-)|eukprot:s3681_g5.t1